MSDEKIKCECRLSYHTDRFHNRQSCNGCHVYGEHFNYMYKDIRRAIAWCKKCHNEACLKIESTEARRLKRCERKLEKITKQVSMISDKIDELFLKLSTL